MDLTTELATDLLERGYSQMDAIAVAASLNAQDRPGPVPAIDVKRYLILQGKWVPIKLSALPSAVNMVETLEVFATIDLGAYGAAIEAAIDAVVSDALLDANDKAAILALADNRRSRAGELGLGVVLPGHIEEART